MSGERVSMLSVRDLSVRFGGVAAVQDVSLDVGEGEIVSLIGPNGAGKTTTVNALTGFVTPTAGSIMFQARDITGWRPEAVAVRGMVRTFQNAAMFSTMTVAENLATGGFLGDRSGVFQVVFRTPSFRGQERAACARVNDVLDRIGLTHRRDMVSSQLPYGEQRILGVGIALMAAPKLLVLDEPAAGLSPQEARVMANLIRAIHAMGTTVLLIEHNMSVVMSVSHRIVVLKQGQVLAQGTPAFIREHPEVVAAYLGAET